MFSAFFRSLKQEFAGYNSKKLLADMMAGLTVCALSRCRWHWRSAFHPARARRPGLSRPSSRAWSSPFSAARRTRFRAPQAR